MTPEQIEEIRQLRDRQVAPKQIARKLGLRPAEVNLAIQQQAAIQQQVILAKGELPPLEGCFANREMVTALFPQPDSEPVVLGIGEVMVVRKQRNRLIAEFFLVDYYCLGVKNVTSFEFSSDEKYRRIKEKAFLRFAEGVTAISLEQAQAIVFGAVDYARGLGFEPHADFAKAKEILGERPDNLLPLEFGKNGKPFYFSGPYDNPKKVLKTLDQSVGKGNYHYMLEISEHIDDDFRFLP